MERKRVSRHHGVGALLACLVAIAGALWLPHAAAANTYNVVACNDAGGANHSWGQWWNSGVSTITSGAGCGLGEYDGNTNKGMFARFIAGSTDPGGAAGGWSFAAPGGNTIASITMSDWITRMQGTGGYAFIASEYGMLEGCFSGPSACGWAVPRHTLAVNGAHTIRTEVGCSSVSCTDTSGNGTLGIVELYAATVTVNDNTAPSVSPSGSLWTGNWVSGTKSVTIAGSDGSDGIQENDLNVDGHAAVVRAHGCDYTYAAPCGNQTDTINYDTRQLSDGSHSLQAVSWDAGRLAATAGTTINVDNHAPDMSQTAVTVAQGEDWSPTNSFDLSWTNPSGQPAPIAKAHYSVCQAASPTTCSTSDGKAVGGGIHSISHVQVPAAGNYVVRVWLEDAAGNVNPAMASVPVHLKFDPTVPGQAAPAHRNGWINAHDAASFPQRITLRQGAVRGPSGIKGYAVTTDGSAPGTTVDVPGEDATITLNDLPEGRNLIKARAISGAGVPAADADIGETEVDVDKSKPEISASGNPDPGQWQRGPVTVTLTGTDQAGLSGMEGVDPNDGSATDPTSKAYVEYRLDGGPPSDVPGAAIARVAEESLPVTVNVDGQHTMTYKAVDFAGNESAEKAVQFKIDRTPPELVAFEAQDPTHPTTIKVAVADKTSGVAGGVVQMRKQGSSGWTDLPTRLEGGHFISTVDDSTLPPGAYEFQARARDVAGNETASNRRRDGSVEVLTAPFRFNTRMAAGIVRPSTKKARPKKVSAKCRRSKKCMGKVRKQRAVARRKAAKRKLKKPLSGTVSTMTVRYGKSALVRGTLLSADGVPIGNQPIDVYQRLDAVGQKLGRIATLRSNAAGRFDYHAPKGASRTLRFQFDGTELLHPAAAQVKLLVTASSTLRANRHRIRNGQRVRFSGRIGKPVIAGLKILDLQAFYRHKWHTFATPRTHANGSWKYTYRFEATSGVVTYKFRVRVRREATYPYKLGYSRTTRVTVRG